MGDRISIQFVNSGLPDFYNKSIVLFSHWRGVDLIDDIKKYLKEIGLSDKSFSSFDRREPQLIMVDFVRWLTKDMDRIDGDLYFGIDSHDGDNSDNGHYIIDLKTNKVKK